MSSRIVRIHRTGSIEIDGSQSSQRGSRKVPMVQNSRSTIPPRQSSEQNPKVKVHRSGSVVVEYETATRGKVMGKFRGTFPRDLR